MHFSKITKANTRLPENAILTLRIIKIIQQRCNKITSRNIAPTALLILMSISVLCNYAVFTSRIIPGLAVAVIVGKILGSLMSPVAVLIIIIACNIAAKVVTLYAKTTRAFKNEKTSAYWKKVLRSLKPEAMKIASFTKIERMTTVHTALAIIRYTGRLIIWFKGKGH